MIRPLAAGSAARCGPRSLQWLEALMVWWQHAIALWLLGNTAVAALILRRILRQNTR